MLLPTVSVAVIGLIAGLLALVVGRSRPARALLLGVVGAWLGFLVGAIVGVSVDIVVESGIYLGIVGHLMAVVGAVVALRHFPNH
jgi:peptidoglycan/LPS O-acetylase OafA/YrhL